MVQSKKKVLVTGAAGFVGSHIATRLLSAGHEVHGLVLSKNREGRLETIKDHIIWHEGDLRDGGALQKIMDAVSPHGVMHLAASNMMSGVAGRASDLVETNFIGTANLLDTALSVGVEFFINTGSFLQYGDVNRPLRETDLLAPRELYSITKISAEHYATVLGKQKNLPVISFRLFTPYGPGLQKGRLVYNLIKNALAGADMPLTHQNIARDFIYLDDVANLYIEAMSLAPRYPGEVFNAGTGVKSTLGELAREVIRAADSPSKPLWGALPQVVYDNEWWQADMTKTFSAFTSRPRFTLAKGIDTTVAWYRVHPEELL